MRSAARLISLPPPRGQTEGRRHHGESGVAAPLGNAMAAFDQGLDLIETPATHQLEDIAQIRTGREGARHAAGLIADDQAQGLVVRVIQGPVDDIDHFGVEDVHLGVKLAADHTVSQIDQGSRWCGEDGFIVRLERCQGDHTFAELNGFVVCGDKIVVIAPGAFGFVKAGVTVGQHTAHRIRHIETL